MNRMVRIYKPTGIANYYISEYGDVRNNNQKYPKNMKQTTTNDNHQRIELKVAPGVPKKFYIHRLVYKAFIGELEDGLVIEHLDGNPQNNYYKNLKQSTQKENIETAISQGTFGNNNCKTVILYDKYNSCELIFNSIKEIYEYLNISYNNGSFTKIKNHNKFKNRFIVLEY